MNGAEDTKASPGSPERPTQEPKKRSAALMEQQPGYWAYLFLSRLDEVLRRVSNPYELHQTAADELGRYLGADRCAYAVVGQDQDSFEIVGDYVRDLPSAVGRYRMQNFGDQALLNMQRNQPWVVADTERDPRLTELDRQAYRALSMQAVVCIPLHREERFAACIAVHSREPRQWRTAEIELVEATGLRCWESAERIKAEKIARSRDARFRALVEDSSQVLWTAAPEGHVVDDSPSWRALTGQSFEEFRGYGWLDALHPDDKPRVLQRVAQHLGTHTGFNVQFRVRRADGRWCWLEEQIRPVKDAAGALIEWVGLGIDITDRMLEEQRTRFLVILDDRLRALIDPDDIAGEAMRLLCEFLQAGRACYLEVEDDQRVCRLIRNHVTDMASLRGDYDLEVFGPAFIEAIRRGHSFRLDDVESSDLSNEQRAAWRAIEIRAALGIPLLKEGKLVALVGIHQKSPRAWRDDELDLLLKVVTRCWESIERARSARALRDADRRKDEFLATLAHELRNPLAPLRTALQIGLQERATVPAARLFQMMDRQVEQLVRLVDDLLDVSRITRGKVELKRECVALGQALNMAIETARPVIDASGHTLELFGLSQPLHVQGDPVRLTQIFANLLNNAAKYTPPGGCLSVRVERAGAEVVIQVADNGIGIAPESLERVFEIFTQVGKGSQRATPGLGIGLALVRSLVKLHGGRVEACSRGVGKGSQFRVRLPLASPPCEPCEPEQAPGRRLCAQARRILVVDDNRDAADSVAMLLRLMGADVLVSYSPEEALMLVAGYQPTMAILDLGMPSIDGFELARRLRALRGDDIRLIALTGWGQASDRTRSKDAGFDEHLMKPVDVASLEALLYVPFETPAIA